MTPARTSPPVSQDVPTPSSRHQKSETNGVCGYDAMGGTEVRVFAEEPWCESTSLQGART
jgi:hypothetical protein